MRQDEAITAPRAQCERYTDATYTLMRDDKARTTAYEQAIRRVAPGRVCLDIGTGALALLALAAARAGAEHVIAVEANAVAAAAARQAVTDAGMASRVTVVEGYSTDVTLDRPVDLLLHEVIGSFAGEEGVVTAVHDAKARHLRRGQIPPTLPHPQDPLPRSVCTHAYVLGSRTQMRACHSRSHRSLARSARRASSPHPSSLPRSMRPSSLLQARSTRSSYRSYRQ